MTEVLEEAKALKATEVTLVMKETVVIIATEDKEQ